MANAMFVIHPYKDEGVWAFDDASRGLLREPFVFGIDDMVEHFSKDIPGAQKGFDLYFSERPFPAFAVKLIWQSSEYEGNWYKLDGTDETGWLCPALLKYFDAPPAEIYCKVAPSNVAARG